MADSQHPSASFFSRRGLLFRFSAILLGLTPFVLFELMCIGFDWGKPEEQGDPFVGFSSTHSLFVRDEEVGEYRIPEARYRFFYRESFPIQKRPDEFRIFCLGGSTVQGRPFSSETSFTTWLELSLQAAAPDRTFDVVNCGGVSYASYRLLPILDEVLDYEPDLVIIYTGHNEFLEDRSYEHLKDRPQLLLKTQAAATHLRTFNLLRSKYEARNAEQHEPGADVHANRPQLPEEVEARLDYRDGMEAYHRDPEWKRLVVAHFQYNIAQMIERCSKRRASILFVNPVSNLRTTPPFKTEWDFRLPPKQLAECQRLFDESRAAIRHDIAIERLLEAARIESGHAGIYYALGKRYDYLEKYEEASRAYLLAKDHDVCPLRMLEPMHDALQVICQRRRIPLVDVRQRFEELSPQGIPGGNLLVDHVHPSILGHQHIAALLMEQLLHQGVLEAVDDWRTKRDALYKAHLDGLDDFYYLQGERRLRGLREWAAGRASLEKATPNETPAP